MKNNYVLTRELAAEETVTPSGLIIPKEKYNRKSVVLSAQEGCDVKEGDVIIKTIGKGTMMTLEDVEYEILHINHIMAVLEDYGTET